LVFTVLLCPEKEGFCQPGNAPESRVFAPSPKLQAPLELQNNKEMSQITPRRLPLAGRSSLGNAASNKNSPGSSPASDSRDLARKATLNALTANLPAPKPPLLGAPERGMDGNQEMTGEVGDTVEVPGGMLGVVKYIGSVTGKAGVFAGVELSKEYAARGKNDGDVDGSVSTLEVTLQSLRTSLYITVFDISRPQCLALASSFRRIAQSSRFLQCRQPS